MTQVMPRGGKRKGAGRPRGLPEPTAPVRVPKSLASWVKDRANWDKLKAWIDADRAN